ncbi:hypothetical protein APHAL10511_005997 [Amanita phalloides]|nr:hypothetical protein APHAL10511_005997 [Amanita phalloides]
MDVLVLNEAPPTSRHSTSRAQKKSGGRGASSGSLSKAVDSQSDARLRKATTDSPQVSTPTTPTMESDLVRALQLIQDLSDQIVLNQKMAASLQSQAVFLKDQAKSTTSGFALRRFNVDLSKETFESELERKNAQLIIENQSFLHDNKQLNALLKEYESMLDIVMSKFRNHALAAQRHELTLTRHYETLIHAREMQAQSSDMSYSIETVQSLHRIVFLLRSLLKCLNGEDGAQSDTLYPEPGQYLSGSHEHGLEANAVPAVDLMDLETLIDQLGDDWTLQRDIEIARLERENEELRKMMKIDPQTMAESEVVFDLDAARASFTGQGRRMIHQRPSSIGSSTSSGDPTVKLMWIEGQQQQQGSSQGNHPPQRMTELQPGMRLGSQVRRPGIIGAGQQRGLFVSGGMASTGNGVGFGNGRPGFNLGIGPPPSTGQTPPALWPPAVSPAPPLVVERPWPGGSGLDLSR